MVSVADHCRCGGTEGNFDRPNSPLITLVVKASRSLGAKTGAGSVGFVGLWVRCGA